MNWLGPFGFMVYLAVGAGLGAVYFILLLRTVRLLVAQAAAIRIFAMHVVRIAVPIAGFWFTAQHGALPLLTALVGFLLTRHIVQRRTTSV